MCDRSRGKAIRWIIVTLSQLRIAFSAPVPLGCFSYGYAYDKVLPNSTGGPFSLPSPLACQQKCRSTTGCFHFGWFENNNCYLGGADALLRDAEPGTVAGPAYCPEVNRACVSLPDASFPGEKGMDSMMAWDGGQQPTALQCWPRSSNGFPARCTNITATVLEDTDNGWPGRCDGLTAMNETGENCQLSCMLNPFCGVWALRTSAASATPVCWHGLMGSNCYSSVGPKPLRAQRLKHGTYRILMNTMGIQIRGLVQAFPGNAFADQVEGIKHCKLHCLSYLLCSHWQFHTSYGCWIENPLVSKVAYPLATGPLSPGAQPGASKTSASSRGIVAGEFIQHNCVGPRSEIPTSSPMDFSGFMTTPAPPPPPPSPRTPIEPESTPWPWWASMLLILFIALCIGVIAAAVWMGMDDRKRREARRKGLGLPTGQVEQASLLHPTSWHMPHMPQMSGYNMHMPWSQNPGQRSTYSGIPGYEHEMHPQQQQPQHNGFGGMFGGGRFG